MKTEIITSCNEHKFDYPRSYFFQKGGKFYAQDDEQTYDIIENKIVEKIKRDRIVKIHHVSTGSTNKLVKPSKMEVGQAASLDGSYIIKIAKNKFFVFYEGLEHLYVSNFNDHDDACIYRLLDTLEICFH